MATNQKADGHTLSATATSPAEPLSGDAVRIGKLCGVALTDEDEASEKATVALDGVFETVVDDNEASGVAIGDKLYFHDTGTGDFGAGHATTHVNNSSGSADAFFGIALGVLTTNQTLKIDVLLRAA
jgi:predicted RecA/RadA family phage recombinase